MSRVFSACIFTLLDSTVTLCCCSLSLNQIHVEINGVQCDFVFLSHVEVFMICKVKKNNTFDASTPTQTATTKSETEMSC